MSGRKKVRVTWQSFAEVEAEISALHARPENTASYYNLLGMLYHIAAGFLEFRDGAPHNAFLNPAEFEILDRTRSVAPLNGTPFVDAIREARATWNDFSASERAR